MRSHCMSVSSMEPIAVTVMPGPPISSASSGTSGTVTTNGGAMTPSALEIGPSGPGNS